MKTSEVLAVTGNGFTYLLATLQTNESFQIVELCLSIAVSLVILLYKIWKWWKEAKADGKITKEEISEGIDIIVDGVEDLKDKTKKEGEKDGKDNHLNQ